MADTWQENGYTTRAMVWSNDDTVGKGIFMGCDNNLYLYKVEEDTYYYVSSVTSTNYIKRLWVNETDNNKIYGVSWPIPSSTGRTTTITIFNWDGTSFDDSTSITGVYTGEYMYQFGKGFTNPPDLSCRAIGYDVVSTYHVGENLIFPFNQISDSVHVLAEDDAPVTFNTASGETINGVTTYVTNNPNASILLNSGYYSFHKYPTVASSTHPLDIRYSMGQNGSIEFIENSGEKGGLLYCKIGREPILENFDTLNFEYYDFNVSLATSITNNYLPMGDIVLPTCMCVNPNSNITYVGLMESYQPSATSTAKFSTYITRLSNIEYNDFASTSIIYCSSADTTNVYRTFLDMKYNSKNNTLYVTFIQRDKYHKGDFFGIATHPIYSQNSLDNIQYFPTMPQGMVIEDETGDVFYTVGKNLYKYNVSGTNTFQDDLDLEYNLSSNLICVPFNEINLIDTERVRSADMIFGVSAPYFPNETQLNPVIGKYYFWKYDNYLTDRIELADFTDMSIWDAITQVSQCGIDYSIGFDTDDEGSFFLSDKTSADYTIALDISTDAIDKNLISIDKDRGLDEVFNYAEITPNIAKIAEIKNEYYRAPRTTTSDEDHAISVDDILVDTKAHHNISLKLICTKNGRVDQIYTNTSGSTFLKWQLYEREIEALVLGDIAVSAETITVASTFRGGNAATKTDNNGYTINNIIESAINIGDYITIVEPDSQTEETKRITNIVGTALTIETNGFSFAIKSQTIAIISHPFDLTSSNVSWSDEGVTTLSSSLTESVSTSTIYVADKRDLSNYLIIKCGNDTVYSRITDIGNWESDNSGYTITLSSAVTATDGDTLYAYFSPSKDINGVYSYFDIGGTGIRVKLEPSSTKSNYEMWVGDRITIISEGMILEESEQSKQTAYDMDSIDARGRLEFDSVSNKFIDRNKAKHIVRKVVKDYSDPHYIITANTLLYPTLRFIDDDGKYVRVRLYSKKMFPNYNEVIMYPRSISHNLKQGTTTIEGRDCDPY